MANPVSHTGSVGSVSAAATLTHRPPVRSATPGLETVCSVSPVPPVPTATSVQSGSMETLSYQGIVKVRIGHKCYILMSQNYHLVVFRHEIFSSIVKNAPPPLKKTISIHCLILYPFCPICSSRPFSCLGWTW